MKIRTTIYKTDNAGKIVQSLIDIGFHKITFENCDGSTIYIEAETYNWKEIQSGD